jgi:hypothetical protein
MPGRSDKGLIAGLITTLFVVAILSAVLWYFFIYKKKEEKSSKAILVSYSDKHQIAHRPFTRRVNFYDQLRDVRPGSECDHSPCQESDSGNNHYESMRLNDLLWHFENKNSKSPEDCSKACVEMNRRIEEGDPEASSYDICDFKHCASEVFPEKCSSVNDIVRNVQKGSSNKVALKSDDCTKSCIELQSRIEAGDPGTVGMDICDFDYCGDNVYNKECPCSLDRIVRCTEESELAEKIDAACKNPGDLKCLGYCDHLESIGNVCFSDYCGNLPNNTQSCYPCELEEQRNCTPALLKPILEECTDPNNIDCAKGCAALAETGQECDVDYCSKLLAHKEECFKCSLGEPENCTATQLHDMIDNGCGLEYKTFAEDPFTCSPSGSSWVLKSYSFIADPDSYLIGVTDISQNMEVDGNMYRISSGGNTLEINKVKPYLSSGMIRSIIVVEKTNMGVCPSNLNGFKLPVQDMVTSYDSLSGVMSYVEHLSALETVIFDITIPNQMGVMPVTGLYSVEITVGGEILTDFSKAFLSFMAWQDYNNDSRFKGEYGFTVTVIAYVPSSSEIIYEKLKDMAASVKATLISTDIAGYNLKTSTKTSQMRSSSTNQKKVRAKKIL